MQSFKKRKVRKSPGNQSPKVNKSFAGTKEEPSLMIRNSSPTNFMKKSQQNLGKEEKKRNGESPISSTRSIVTTKYLKEVGFFNNGKLKEEMSKQYQSGLPDTKEQLSLSDASLIKKKNFPPGSNPKSTDSRLESGAGSRTLMNNSRLDSAANKDRSIAQPEIMK